MKPKILFLMQMPPPVHGVSVISQNIINSKRINCEFENTFINISLAKSMEDLGKIGFAKLFRFPWLFLNVLQVLLKKNFEVVYITLSPHGCAFYKDSILLLISKFFVNRRVIHLHGKGIDQEVCHSKLKKLIYSFVFKGCSVIHLSKLLRDDVSELTGIDKQFDLPNGVVCNSKAQGIVEYKRANNRINFLYLSNMATQKGWRTAMAACSLLKAQGYDLKFTFAGSWTKTCKQSDFDELVKKYNLSDVVEYVGPKYGDDKLELFTSHDVFVFPTFYRNECFPLVILEAFSFGLPVISTSEGAISEIVDNELNGFVISKNSADELAEVMMKYIICPEILNSQKKNALSKFSENYSFDIFEANFIKILTSLSVSL